MLVHGRTKSEEVPGSALEQHGPPRESTQGPQNPVPNPKQWHYPCPSCPLLQPHSLPPVSTQLQWARKGKQGGYGESSQLGSSWGHAGRFIR